MWFVRLATEDAGKVLDVAEEIRATLKQEGIGIEYRSRYYRCTADDPASDLSKFLDAEDSDKG